MVQSYLHFRILKFQLKVFPGYVILLLIYIYIYIYPDISLYHIIFISHFIPLTSLTTGIISPVLLKSLDPKGRGGQAVSGRIKEDIAEGHDHHSLQLTHDLDGHRSRPSKGAQTKNGVPTMVMTLMVYI